MFKIAWKLTKFAIVAPLLTVGVITSLWFAGKYDHRFSLSLFDGKTVLTVLEVYKSGDAYLSKRYTLTDANHLYITRKQGLEIDHLVEVGQVEHIVITQSDREMLVDVAMMIEPVTTREIRADEPYHYVSIRLGDDNSYYTTVPEQQKVAAVLARGFQRFSTPTPQP